jgi:type IV secretory pathway component VirB8
VSTYAFTTQARFSCEKSSPAPIEGRATLTIDASRTTMNWAKQSSARAIQRQRSNSWAVVIIGVSCLVAYICAIIGS